MRRLAVIALGIVLAVLVASQLVLPGLAERDLRADLEATGDVRSVEVSAFPALTLLADRADSATVRIGAARAGTGRLGDLLASTDRVDRLDATVESLALGPLALTDLRLRKRGARLEGAAMLSEQALARAVPAAVGLRPVASEGGALVFEASAAGIGVRARLSARDGALVVAPEGLLGGLASLTVFEDPRIEMTGVAAEPTAGGYALTATGRLR